MAFAADFCRSLTRIRRNKVSSISAFTQAMFGIKGMHRSISYLRLMVGARQLIHGSGLGGGTRLPNQKTASRVPPTPPLLQVILHPSRALGNPGFPLYPP